jgi:hypothetical protein
MDDQSPTHGPLDLLACVLARVNIGERLRLSALQQFEGDLATGAQVRPIKLAAAPVVVGVIVIVGTGGYGGG